MEKYVCFTGHRPKDIPLSEVEPIKLWLRDTIERAARAGYNNFISGMAIGVDTWAAEAVLDVRTKYPELKVTLVAAVPFVGQEAKWPDFVQAHYNYLLDEADIVVTVCNGGYSAEKMQRRNEWMVDHSDAVIAVWSGKTYGGTANCLRYAKEKRCPVRYYKQAEIKTKGKAW